MAGTALANQPAISSGSRNIIDALMEHHRLVLALFAQFQRSTALLREQELAFDICEAVRLHADIAEELVYPTLCAANGQRDLANNATADLRAVRDFIAELERTSPTEETFHSKVYVLCQMFDEYVKKELSPRGLLANAARSGLDLAGLGEAVRERRLQRGAPRQQ